MRDVVALARRSCGSLEPWYDWGKINFSRLDAVERDFSDESEGEGRYFELQWFGLHLQINVGIVPPKVDPATVQRNKTLAAEWARSGSKKRDDCVRSVATRNFSGGSQNGT